MKKISIFGCITAALLSLAGCEQTGNYGYEGTNYIYLESAGANTTVWEQDETPLVMNVMLTSTLSEDLVLTFEIEGTDGILELQNNPVTIPAGLKKASFAVVSNNADLVSSVENFKIKLDASTVLPDKVRIKSDFNFVVRSASVSALTDEQKVIVSTYKETAGVDLSKYLGLVNVSVEYTGFDNENKEPLDPVTYSGKTLIALSDESTAELPVLKMVANAMGIQSKMYEALRAVTIEDIEEVWTNFDSYPDNGKLVEVTGWTSESQEVFSVSLDGIKLNADNTIDFLGTGMGQWQDEIIHVPFEYNFSAYERELAAIESEEFVKKPDTTTDCTFNPYYHLNHNAVDSDEWKRGNWIEASAEITDENMVFTFCLYMSNNDYDYTRVVATYTPNN